jgi:hypothetical protein
MSVDLVIHTHRLPGESSVDKQLPDCAVYLASSDGAVGVYYLTR